MQTQLPRSISLTSVSRFFAISQTSLEREYLSPAEENDSKYPTKDHGKVIIADAGPLIALAKIEQLNVLPVLFGQIRITQAVADECLARETRDSELINQALLSGWLIQVITPEFKHDLSRSLGVGEQSSIEYALNLEKQALLIIDDKLARKQALSKNLNVIGTAAILFAAQNKHVIQDAEEVILRLKQKGYRISEQVVAILKATNKK